MKYVGIPYEQKLSCKSWVRDIIVTRVKMRIYSLQEVGLGPNG
jgi:hypothetical protein